MSADQYLMNILIREAVDTGPYSSVRNAYISLLPTIQSWAGNHLINVQPSGSFAKGTANKSGTDLDIFISIAQTNPFTLEQTYENLFDYLQQRNYHPKKQNVSINITFNGYSVDLVPAQIQDYKTLDHSLWRRRANTWTKTNIDKHINYVRQGGRINVTRILKLWRNQKNLDFPSFYIEMTVINALSGWNGGLADGVRKVFQYLKDSFATTRLLDPANTNNIISDDLSSIEKNKIIEAAKLALNAKNWNEIVK